jgi:hypothetical protein
MPAEARPATACPLASVAGAVTLITRRGSQRRPCTALAVAWPNRPGRSPGNWCSQSCDFYFLLIYNLRSGYLPGLELSVRILRHALLEAGVAAPAVRSALCRVLHFAKTFAGRAFESAGAGAREKNRATVRKNRAARKVSRRKKGASAKARATSETPLQDLGPPQRPPPKI